jgi:threonine dehydrogenase-like Zn-dependent dehydrogenase
MIGSLRRYRALGETLGPQHCDHHAVVDTVTTPMLLKVVRSGKLKPSKLVTHRFVMNDILKAYETFGNAAKEGALKVVLTNGGLR